MVSRGRSQRGRAGRTPRMAAISRSPSTTPGPKEGSRRTGSRHGRACGEQLASPTLSEPVAFSVTPERWPLTPKCLGSMPPWRPNSMGTSGSGAARIPRFVRGGGFWATRGSRRRRSTELTNPVSRRRFVPSSVPPVPQLAENTGRADGLLSRMPGVRVPPGAPTPQCLPSLSRRCVARPPRGG